MLAPAPLRSFEAGRQKLTEIAPEPRTASATRGFRVELIGHGMARLVDPQGAPCGVFANRNLAPATLAFLAR